MGVREKLMKSTVFTVEHDGETFELAKLSGASFAAIQSEMSKLKADESLDSGLRDMRIAALMLVFSLVEDGRLAFTPDDIDFVVNEVPLALVRKIGEAVSEKNGLMATEEDTAKNS